MLSRTLFFLIVIGTSTAVYAQSVLLIPDGENNRVAAFSPIDGTIIDLDFVPSDPIHLLSPFAAVDSGRGTIFVSDVLADSVFEYGMDGSFLGTFADASDGLDDIRGIAQVNGALYVTVCGNGGGLADTIQQFDVASGSQTTWTDDEINGPYDILFLTGSSNVLVSNINTNDIEEYDINGNFAGTFHPSNGVDGIDFPEQLHETANGDILAGGFFDPRGIYRYDSAGTEIAYFNVGSSVRGVYELQNGNILWTNTSAVFSLNPATGMSQLITGDGNFRYIKEVTPILLGDINLDGQVDLLDVAPFVILLNTGKFQIEADINGDGVISLLDVGPFVEILSDM